MSQFLIKRWRLKSLCHNITSHATWQKFWVYHISDVSFVDNLSTHTPSGRHMHCLVRPFTSTPRFGFLVISVQTVDRIIRFNSLRPKQNGRHFPDGILKWIFLNEHIWISIYISVKFVSTGPTNSIPALVQIMVWRRPVVKPLSEPLIV